MRGLRCASPDLLPRGEEIRLDARSARGIFAENAVSGKMLEFDLRRLRCKLPWECLLTNPSKCRGGGERYARFTAALSATFYGKMRLNYGIR